jgi:hypothetical protein
MIQNPGIKTIYAKKNPFGGEYTLEFEQDGTYEIELSPFEANLEINKGLSDGQEATEQPKQFQIAWL